MKTGEKLDRLMEKGGKTPKIQAENGKTSECRGGGGLSHAFRNCYLDVPTCIQLICLYFEATNNSEVDLRFVG